MPVKRLHLKSLMMLRGVVQAPCRERIATADLPQVLP